MQTINSKEFGQFITELRKEKGLTQKQLAQKLFLSDKAVSKWERGLGFPDISLLIPLSKMLEVTTTELLSGKRIENSTQFTVDEVDLLMEKTITLSGEEKISQNKSKINRIAVFSVAIVIFVLELIVYLAMGYSIVAVDNSLLTLEILMLIFGVYFTFFVREILPAYYDENKISQYSHGMFRINMAGLAFNNSNWKPIVKTMHISIMGIFILLPIAYLSLNAINPSLWQQYSGIITLCTLLFMFIPMYVVGKRNE